MLQLQLQQLQENQSVMKQLARAKELGEAQRKIRTLETQLAEAKKAHAAELKRMGEKLEEARASLKEGGATMDTEALRRELGGSAAAAKEALSALADGESFDQTRRRLNQLAEHLEKEGDLRFG